ncbi:MAG: FtsX-like permease family protein [Turicibacter sp.]|nr:FtsX-like permease family protein [Turicibacter sp.]
MGTLKRSLISLARNYKKSAAFFVMAFILGNLIVGAMGIQQAVVSSHRNLRRMLPPVVTIQQDRAATEEWELTEEEWIAWNISSMITPEMVERLGSLPYVSEVENTLVATMYNRQLELVGDAHGMVDAGNQPIQVKGVNRPQFGDLNAGLVNILYGRTLSESELELEGNQSYALISREFAQLNRLMVGSRFQLENNTYEQHAIRPAGFTFYADEDIRYQEIYELEVIGIFEVGRGITTGDEWMDSMLEWEITNQVYVPFDLAGRAWNFNMMENVQMMYNLNPNMDIATAIQARNDNGILGELLFLLHDPLYIEDFAQELSEIVPAGFWYVQDLSNSFADMANAMENMLWIASLIQNASLVASILIFTLLIVFLLRDRQQEIGIYLALGETKLKVFLQFLWEILISGGIAIGLSLLSGSFLASALSETLLHQEVVSQQATRQIAQQQEGSIFVPGFEVMGWFSPGYFTVEEMMENYQFDLPPTVILQFLASGFALILLSVTLSNAYLITLNPKKLLM